ncbi:HlyD family efflux transporter periplasmic adaptor subunit [Nodularia harveyana UHCC-0300]|uniref:HlyD family efflux transporter periplasmic adaptor subunit n=1 Tax=Nodularia harveyana UHCC-0300 TaxID=2974287 RepID=A0ABU5UBU7_9CYAN|nr:HlyD family efflux transporter periplasmic adaptor subunit [Nodularia harveyana]MEA5581000.1 HlyD family efflux transporter periplasmic adaptor subunit [Nodularia harveyana UHCC-0300]
MPETLNQTINNEYNQDQLANPAPVTDDWSHVTKDLLDSLPQVWTRGLLYFLIVFVSIVLPWAMFSRVDETGVARGRLEPQGKTVRLDAPVAGTVAEINVKVGDVVETGQTLLVLESELVQAELGQTKDRLEGQLNRLSQLNLLKNQLIVALATQRQQNQSQELEKQSQIDQASQNLTAIKSLSNFQKEEKLSQVNQAKQSVVYSKTAHELTTEALASSQRELKRYHQLWEQGVSPETVVVEKQDIVQQQERLYEQSKSDMEQAQLRLAEQHSSYERTIRQFNADIQQAELRLNEQENGYKTLTHSGKLAVLRTEEQLKNIDTEISTLNAEIAQTKSQIQSWEFQLNQRVIKANVTGTLFQLPIEKSGSVVQPGTMIAEIAPTGSPLIVRSQMATTESGSLRQGLPVKLKFDAYPFQDYGVIAAELLKISPNTIEIDTPNGKVAAYELEISINQDCIPSPNQCIPLNPGDTVTAEVIVRQRRIIDFLLDPFKQLQQGGVKL